MNPEEDNLVELRYWVPENEGGTATAEFSNKVIDKAGLSISASSLLCQMGILNFTVPRGKYEVELYNSFFKMSSKTSVSIPFLGD